MKATSTRLDVPASAAAAIATAAMPTAASVSPLRAAFEEWKHLRAWTEQVIDDQGRDRLVFLLNQAEAKVLLSRLRTRRTCR